MLHSHNLNPGMNGCFPAVNVSAENNRCLSLMIMKNLTGSIREPLCPGVSFLTDRINAVLSYPV